MSKGEDKTLTERVTQLWPKALKKEVRELVGQRGLTDFTLDAVREKLSKHKGQPSKDTIQQPTDPEPVQDMEPVRLTDAAEALDIHPEEPLIDEGRPEEVHDAGF